MPRATIRSRKSQARDEHGHENISNTATMRTENRVESATGMIPGPPQFGSEAPVASVVDNRNRTEIVNYPFQLVGKLEEFSGSVTEDVNEWLSHFELM